MGPWGCGLVNAATQLAPCAKDIGHCAFRINSPLKVIDVIVGKEQVKRKS